MTAAATDRNELICRAGRRKRPAIGPGIHTSPALDRSIYEPDDAHEFVPYDGLAIARQAFATTMTASRVDHLAGWDFSKEILMRVASRTHPTDRTGPWFRKKDERFTPTPPTPPTPPRQEAQAKECPSPSAPEPNPVCPGGYWLRRLRIWVAGEPRLIRINAWQHFETLPEDYEP